jgi:glycine/D-amino acid oxidase-like deaminating enzyme
VHDTDVVVLGAGIYGCSTAYFLARAGVPVVVIDADDIGAGASGANAGNLHLQLSPFSHAAKDDAWVAEFARTLPFFIESLASWQRLARELPGDIELRCSGRPHGGETDGQMQVLHQKVELERSQGLNVEHDRQRELRRRAPYLAPHLLGASFCPDEGMANALTAVDRAGRRRAQRGRPVHAQRARRTHRAHRQRLARRHDRRVGPLRSRGDCRGWSSDAIAATGGLTFR